MSTAAQNPEVLNELMENLIMGLLDQAQGEFEGRSGKKIKLGALQKLKLDGAKKVTQMALNRIGKGDAEERFEEIAKLTNKYIPLITSAVGEDNLVARVEKLPEDVRDREVVELLDEGGAHELAKLLRKVLPGWEEEARLAEEQAAVAAAEPVEDDIHPAGTPEEAGFERDEPKVVFAPEREQRSGIPVLMPEIDYPGQSLEDVVSDLRRAWIQQGEVLDRLEASLAEKPKQEAPVAPAYPFGKPGL